MREHAASKWPVLTIGQGELSTDLENELSG
jgi:hypothetical protein